MKGDYMLINALVSPGVTPSRRDSRYTYYLSPRCFEIAFYARKVFPLHLFFTGRQPNVKPPGTSKTSESTSFCLSRTLETSGWIVGGQSYYGQSNEKRSTEFSPAQFRSNVPLLIEYAMPGFYDSTLSKDWMTVLQISGADNYSYPPPARSLCAQFQSNKQGWIYWNVGTICNYIWDYYQPDRWSWTRWGYLCVSCVMATTLVVPPANFDIKIFSTCDTWINGIRIGRSTLE